MACSKEWVSAVQTGAGAGTRIRQDLDSASSTSLFPVMGPARRRAGRPVSTLGQSISSPGLFSEPGFHARFPFRSENDAAHSGEVDQRHTDALRIPARHPDLNPTIAPK